jgi:hypothetical protein
LDLRFNRLKASLRGYEFEIIYKKAKKNTNADALSRNHIIEEGQENPERPRAELYLLDNKQEEERQDSEKNVPPARVMIIEANRERKRKGKGSDSPGSDNPRARKIQRNEDESNDSGEEWRVGKITDLWKPKKKGCVNEKIETNARMDQSK